MDTPSLKTTLLFEILKNRLHGLLEATVPMLPPAAGIGSLHHRLCYWCCYSV